MKSTHGSIGETAWWECRGVVGILPLGVFGLLAALGGCSENYDDGPNKRDEVFRSACVKAVNEFRATKGLPAYARWTSAESCTDEEANLDKKSGRAHGSFGRCQERAQNACPGWNTAGLRDCLQSMWDEKNQAGCSGCDDCADRPSRSCSNCDFYGSETGDTCGHYVNMSAKYLSKVSCGAASDGTWLIFNFQ